MRAENGLGDPSDDRALSPLRIVAILAAYNEERFIGACLEHLFGQGVDAYLIDNGSTDGTVEIAKGYLGCGLIGIEDFPRERDEYRWQPILERKEELAATLEADWFIHADPDEIRLAPRAGETLAEAFARVESEGYNAVNFLEFTFVPTREEPDHDHPDFLRTMRHYYPFVRNFPYQVKAWKRQPKRVALAVSGGHRVRFPGLLLHPESFKMKHYPYLSVPHILSKYVDKSYDAEELEQGWHRNRAGIDPKRISFPSNDELNTLSPDGELDESNPRAQHIIAGWNPPKQKQGREQSTPRDEATQAGARTAAPNPKAPSPSQQVPAQNSSADERTGDPGSRRGGEKPASGNNVGNLAGHVLGAPKRKIGRLARSLSVQRSISASGRKILRAVGDPTDVTLLTGRGNIGDHLIHAGTRQLLSGIDYKEAKVWRTKKDGVQGLQGLGGHTALIAGSGGWSGPFHWLWPAALPRLEERFERVIVLPSTVDTTSEPVREALAQTRALFFAREQESYRQLRELGEIEIEIAHDCAFFFDFGPYQTRGKGLLKAYRTDAEASGGRIPRGNDDISKTCDTLDEFLWKIARHRVVGTDRAHVMIAGAMLGKKVRYRASNYHKVPTIAEYSLQNFSVERMPDARPAASPKRRAVAERARSARPQPASNADGRTGVRAENVVWIFGTARTGSTWLSSMMSDLPGFARWNEPYVGALFGPTFFKLGWHLVAGRKDSILSPHYADVWSKAVRCLVLEGAEARFPELGGEGCLIVKDPHGSVGATAVMNALPESRMVLLVRDPRDVVASILDGTKEGGWRKSAWEETHKDPDAFVKTRAELYLESVGTAKEAFDAHSGPRALVRYEELRSDALGSMRRLCSALGITVGEDELARVVRKHAWEEIPDAKKGKGKFYRKAEPGGWQEDLTHEQARTIETITAPLLDELYRK